MASSVNQSQIDQIGSILLSQDRPLKERFRALFTLRSIGGPSAIEWIAKSFSDPSELLKHECGYCLGQMGDKEATPYLIDVLTDMKQEPIVRHEAAEALAAIGALDVLDLLREYSEDPSIEVAETCQLAVSRLEWLQNKANNEEELSENPFCSVDPAPSASLMKDISILKAELLDENLPLFERYRAMFSLRNKGDEESILALTKGLKCSSALFRHEIAYVLGQVAHEVSVKQLSESLMDSNEHPMVRHECAEALGSIATPECNQVLEKYLTDPHRVVKESCEVALDMCDYAQTDAFQYADTLSKVSN